jgi:hypothetical protein
MESLTIVSLSGMITLNDIVHSNLSDLFFQYIKDADIIYIEQDTYQYPLDILK